MAYRIDPGEPTDAELRRIIDEQLAKAVRLLRRPNAPDAADIHEVRKRLKKVRSALRLGRADFGPRVRHHANDEFRRVGRVLSTQRDADAQVEAINDLLSTSATTGVTDRDDHALLQARSILAVQAEELRDDGALDRASVLGAVRTLEQTGTWLARVKPQRTGWDGLAPGLTREYGRGQDAMADLGDAPSVDDLHEWRKRVKDLWYHQRLLRDLWPDVQKPVIAAADELADVLGQDHDLGLLIARLAPPDEYAPADVRSVADEVDPLPVDPDVRDLVTAVARNRRGELQAAARWIGGRLYADRPKAWARRHGSWWALSRPVDVGADEPAPPVDNA